MQRQQHWVITTYLSGPLTTADQDLVVTLHDILNNWLLHVFSLATGVGLEMFLTINLGSLVYSRNSCKPLYATSHPASSLCSIIIRVSPAKNSPSHLMGNPAEGAYFI